MPLFSGLLGASSGVLITVWANALSKQRYLARPWNILLIGTVGAYVGYNLPVWEDELFDKVNTLRVKREMQPIKRESLSDYLNLQDLLDKSKK